MYTIDRGVYGSRIIFYSTIPIEYGLKIKRLWLSLSRITIILAGIVFVISLSALICSQLINNHVANKISGSYQYQYAENSAPSTNPISDLTFNNYKVAANRPRYIFISKISTKAIVLPLGTTKTNQLLAPPNVFAAGWYKNSALPGKAGAMLIDGHVSSWKSHGVFYNLKKLIPGDTVKIQRGDGAELIYKIVKTQVYSSANVDMKAAITPIISNKPGLNIITCTGKVIPGTNEFNQRLIVFTSQL
ncbi:MAG TPA: class F sortase [Candidatus Saccharimonadales bacterium]|nr:class F sortase [Candidatus Saccharimonadales bacterium]